MPNFELVAIGDGSEITQCSYAESKAIETTHFKINKKAGPTKIVGDPERKIQAPKKDKFVNILQYFCNEFQSATDPTCISVALTLKSGTCASMNSAGISQDRPKDGFRIDMQHWNTKDARPGVQGTADFQIQTNDGSDSLAEVMLPPVVPIPKGTVLKAFRKSLNDKRAYLIKIV